MSKFSLYSILAVLTYHLVCVYDRGRTQPNKIV